MRQSKIVVEFELVTEEDVKTAADIVAIRNDGNVVDGDCNNKTIEIFQELRRDNPALEAMASRCGADFSAAIVCKDIQDWSCLTGEQEMRPGAAVEEPEMVIENGGVLRFESTES